MVEDNCHLCPNTCRRLVQCCKKQKEIQANRRNNCEHLFGRDRIFPAARSRAYSASQRLINWTVLLKLIFHLSVMSLVATNNLGGLAFVKGQLLTSVLVPLNNITEVVQFSHQMLKFPSEFQFSENVYRTPKNVIVTSLCVNSVSGYGLLYITYISFSGERNTPSD